MIEKMKFETEDGLSENVEKIAALFPSAVSEGKVNFEQLRTLLGDEVTGDEAYEFTWVGKREAMREAGRPTRKTLRPCPEESKDWDTTENLYIEGDNLDVLKLLQESYLGRVKMIYIDPPYNTGNDFIYQDDFTVTRDEYDQDAGAVDEEGDRLFRNTESNGRFHSDWCSMMYPRLVLARNLLNEDGVIFISIDDNEQQNLKNICDDVFGARNFVTQFVWEKTSHFGRQKLNFYSNCEYVVVYAKNIVNTVGLKELLVEHVKTDLEDAPLYNGSNPENVLVFPPETVFFNISDGVYTKSTDEKFDLLDSVVVEDSKNVNQFSLRMRSRWSPKKVLEEISNGCSYWVKSDKFSIRVIYGDGKESKSAPRQLVFTNRNNPMCSFDRFNIKVGTNDEGSSELISLLEGSYFSYPKPTSLLRYLISLQWDYHKEKFDVNSLVLDFFSGSATTAHAVMQLNAEDGGKRRFIMVQLDEETEEGSEAYKAGYKNICEIGKERIRRAGEKTKAELTRENKQLQLGEEPKQIPDIGFRVLKLDESNMKDVFYTAGEYNQTLLDQMTSNIKEDRTDLDLLYGCLLEWGLPLSLPHTQETIEGITVHTYNLGDLVACFAENVSESLVKQIASRQPLRVVFRDASFTDSPARINVEEIFKLLAPNTSVKVI